MKILLEFISYFFEYKHFNLDILFCRTPCTLTLNCRQLALTSYKAFLKNKERSGRGLSCYILLTNQMCMFYTTLYSINWLPLLREILGNMCIVI